MEEIQEHPRTGTGQVEPLKCYDANVYSRRITHEHRLVYRIYSSKNYYQASHHWCGVGPFFVGLSPPGIISYTMHIMLTYRIKHGPLILFF